MWQVPGSLSSILHKPPHSDPAGNHTPLSATPNRGGQQETHSVCSTAAEPMDSRTRAGWTGCRVARDALAHTEVPRAGQQKGPGWFHLKDNLGRQGPEALGAQLKYTQALGEGRKQRKTPAPMEDSGRTGAGNRSGREVKAPSVRLREAPIQVSPGKRETGQGLTVASDIRGGRRWASAAPAPWAVGSLLRLGVT